jgi:mycothiol synthase
MSVFSSHLFTDQRDREAILALVKDRPTDQLMDFPSLADLREMLSLPESHANTTLWEDLDGKLAGFAILTRNETSCNLIFEISPRVIASDLPAQIIHRAEQVSRQLEQISLGELVLETGCRANALARLSLLGQNGFARQSVETLHLVRPLNDSIPTPLLPPGFSICSSRGAQEVSQWVKLHRAAFGTQNMTEEYRLAMLNTPDYDPYLDLVAVAPNGNLSAYCVGYIDHEGNLLSGQKVGFSDPIATYPAFQRQGLARALLLTVLERLQKRGMLAARLGTGSENIAMLRAAQSVGFREISRSITFSKKV